MKIALSNGTFYNFAGVDAVEVKPVLDWFRDAPAGAVLTLKLNDLTVHLQKAHIVSIEMSR